MSCQPVERASIGQEDACSIGQRRCVIWSVAVQLLSNYSKHHHGALHGMQHSDENSATSMFIEELHVTV
jgi:hypothetical protein